LRRSKLDPDMNIKMSSGFERIRFTGAATNDGILQRFVGSI
jgi:hypothetical protein